MIKKPRKQWMYLFCPILDLSGKIATRLIMSWNWRLWSRTISIAVLWQAPTLHIMMINHSYLRNGVLIRPISTSFLRNTIYMQSAIVDFSSRYRISGQIEFLSRMDTKQVPLKNSAPVSHYEKCVDQYIVNRGCLENYVQLFTDRNSSMTF